MARLVGSGPFPTRTHTHAGGEHCGSAPVSRCRVVWAPPPPSRRPVCLYGRRLCVLCLVFDSLAARVSGFGSGVGGRVRRWGAASGALGDETARRLAPEALPGRREVGHLRGHVCASIWASAAPASKRVPRAAGAVRWGGGGAMAALRQLCAARGTGAGLAAARARGGRRGAVRAGAHALLCGVVARAAQAAPPRLRAATQGAELPWAAGSCRAQWCAASHGAAVRVRRDGWGRRWRLPCKAPVRLRAPRDARLGQRGVPVYTFTPVLS